MTIFIQIKWWPDMFTYGCLISSFVVKEFWLVVKKSRNLRGKFNPCYCFLFSLPLFDTDRQLKLRSLMLKLTLGWTWKERGSRQVWDLRGKFNPNQCFLSVGLFPAPPIPTTQDILHAQCMYKVNVFLQMIGFDTFMIDKLSFKHFHCQLIIINRWFWTFWIQSNFCLVVQIWDTNHIHHILFIFVRFPTQSSGKSDITAWYRRTWLTLYICVSVNNI